jgi:hypothetical protein
MATSTTTPVPVKQADVTNTSSVVETKAGSAPEVKGKTLRGTELWDMFRRTPALLHLPNQLKLNAQKIFSMKKTKVIREYGLKLAEAYKALHSTEQPMDISRVQPFVNSDEIFQQRGTLYRGYYKTN